MNFLLDECFTDKFAPMLRSINEWSEHLILHIVADLEMGGIDDEDWIARLDPNVHWALLTRDARMSKLKLERDAWVQRGIVGFFFARQWGQAPNSEQAWRIVRWWPVLVELAERSGGGVGYRIPWMGQPSRRLTPLP